MDQLLKAAQGRYRHHNSCIVFVPAREWCSHLAHVPEAVCEHYPNIDQGLLDECRQLVLAMVAAWRWELGDQFPDGKRFGEGLLRALHDGPPWPTLDTMNKRLGGL